MKLLNEANKVRFLYFLVFCCTASWLPVFADYLKSRGLSGVEIGFTLSITPLMMFVVQPFYGVITDKLGYNKTLLFSSFFAALSYFLYLFDGLNYWSIIGITICMSVFYNSIQPILDSLSLRLVEQNPKFSYGSIRIAGAMGWAATGILIGNIIDQINLTMIFMVSGVSMLLLFVFAFTLPKKLTENLKIESTTFQNVSKVFRDKNLLFFLLAVFLISAGSFCIYNFYSLYMKQNGASATLVGYALSFQGLCELPFFYLSSRIIVKFGIKTTFLITVFITALRMILYALISNPYWAVSIELLQGISWSLFWVVCVEYVNQLVKYEWRATGQSLLYAAFYGVGAIVGNIWTGYLYDLNLKLSSIFLLNAIIVIVTGFFIGFVMKKSPDSIKQ